MAPSSHFVQGILANISYWQAELEKSKAGLPMRYDTAEAGLSTAVDYGLVLPETQAAAATLLIACFRQVEQWGHWSNWIPSLQKAINQTKHLPRSLHIKLLNRLGHLQRLNQQIDEALITHTRAEAFCQENDIDPTLLAETHLQLGEDHRRLRQYDLANKYGSLALAGLNETDSDWPVALNNLGLIAWEQGALTTAVEYLEKAVAGWLKWNRPTQIGRSYTNLGLVQRQQGQFEAAHASLQAATDWLSQTGSDLDKLKVDNEIGILHFQQEEYAQAEIAFRRADNPFLRRSGNIQMRAALAQNLGNTLLRQGRLIEAEVEIERAIGLWRLTKDEIELANSLGTLAEIKKGRDLAADALPCLEEALALLESYPQSAWASKLTDDFHQLQRACLS